MIFGIGPGSAFFSLILQASGLFFIVLLIISVFRFKKHIIWKGTALLSLSVVILHAWIMAPLLFDFRKDRELHINLNDLKVLPWTSSGFTCSSSEHHSGEDCSSNEYINQTVLVLPDAIRLQFESDIIRFSKIDGNLVSITLRLKDDAMPKEAALILKEGMAVWLRGAKISESSKNRYQDILTRLNKNEAVSNSSTFFGYKDEVCANRGKYLACMSLYGDRTIGIYHSIRFPQERGTESGYSEAS